MLWVVHVDPAGEHDMEKRCKHVNYVSHTLVDGEAEFLFTAYSVFTVRKVEWDVHEGGDTFHKIELDAASDNNPAAEGRSSGRWATPPHSEHAPLAPWY